MNNFTCLFILTILSLSQGFPRPSLDKANRRQGVHYGYPESSSEPYTSTQATSYSENPSYATTWSKPAESTTSNPASQESIASYQNPAADQNSPARETTTASPYAAQTADRPTETPQDQSKQTQTQADQNTGQKPTTQSPYASQTADRQAETAQAQNTQAQTQSGQTSAQQAATDTSTQDQSSQTQGDQSSSQKATTSSPYAASQSPNTPQGQDTQSKTSTSQTQDSTSPQKPATQTQDSTSPQNPATQTQDSTSPQNPATQTQDSTSPQNPATQTQDSTSPQNPATQTQDSTSPQNPATQTQDATSPQNPATQTQDSTSSQNPATQTQDSTTPQSPATQTQDSTSPQNPATQTQDSTSPQNTASQTSTQSTADTSSTQTQAQAPQNQDPSTAPNQPQASQSSTQSQSETQPSSQATQGGQSNDYNQNKGNNEYVNPPKPYNEAQSNPQSASSSDNSQYKVDKVISKTASDSSQGNPSSPVYLSSSGTANVADSSKPDDKSKSATVNKETTVNGNHATTYLELPKIIHKPAIVKYQVQIAPKVKGVPIEQEIAIMPPDGGKGERKPLVLLKQVVSKPTDERIQVIVPKSESSTISSPKVEVKGGHLDQEALNGQDQANGQNQDRGQGQPQGQYQGQGQEQSQSQDQTQSQDQSQDSACGDLSMCENYNPNMCNQVWMKRHCKKLCGLCTPPEDEISLSSAPSEETSGPKHCEYSGVIHQSGETWSPGPCVPKCHCNNGIIKCSKLECPDLNCDKPIKRRWKCCPECLPNSDNETRCGVDTTGGNAENLCCVFPFNYRGIDYFTCTTADAQEPWCSITRNYDRDGLWGNCVAKSETEKKHVKQADSDEKTALVLAAQLSGARKWRNSTNNQATEALKDVQNPLSQKDLDQLKASDSPSAYSDNAYKNTSGADANGVYQNNPSAQDEYYRNAGADPSQLKTLSYAFQGNSTPPVTSPATTSSSSSTSQVTSSGGNPSNAYQQTTSSAYGDSYAKESNPVASSTPGSSTAATNPADSNPVAPSSPAPSIAEASPADSNPVAPSSPAPSTAETNPRDSNPVAPSSPAPSIAEANPADSNPVAPSSPAPSPAEANPVASNAAGSNTPASSQYYGDANSSSGVSAYSNSYGQQSTAKDTTDNTVPNGIENQTSYEMNPDASTAQYANTQPAST